MGDHPDERASAVLAIEPSNPGFSNWDFRNRRRWKNILSHAAHVAAYWHHARLHASSKFRRHWCISGARLTLMDSILEAKRKVKCREAVGFMSAEK